ncbi:hypothetical protein FSP39_003141 [Pinctada imbricata]|uniref:Poly [ADP-ribose] polymerase n=1 Tax=Pinctada imbricata TaxID=66713 RepID=A0AA89BYM5_PINIB|nr:hypothetical protein FSP39_003141 [Pinctada imbricata]
MRKYVKHFDLYDVDDKTLSAIKNLLQDTWKTVGRGRDGRNLNHNGINVTKVERVENVNLFIKYNTNRRHMLKSQRPFRKLEDIPSSSGQILTMTKIDHLMLSDIDINRNECYLFHGTKNTFHENIMSKGLDPRLSSGGAMFGTGVYTAESPSKADHYTGRLLRTVSTLQSWTLRST